MHEDGLLNNTELALGPYPFPSEQIIASRRIRRRSEPLAYIDVRKVKDLHPYRGQKNKHTYRIFPNGTVFNYYKTIFADSERVPLDRWVHTKRPHCGGGQKELAQDPESSAYREDDGSRLFLAQTQSDFLYVPTKCTDKKKAAEFHLKHGIWIDGKIVGMMRENQTRGPAIVSVIVSTAWSCNLDKDIKDLSSLETYKAAGETKEQRDDIVGKVYSQIM